MAAEDHGAGTQYVRCRVWPKCSAGGVIFSLTLALLSAGAGLDGAWPVCALLGAGAFLSIYKTVRDCGGASAAMLQAIQEHGAQTAEQQNMVAHV
jgi:hypothetical protein